MKALYLFSSMLLLLCTACHQEGAMPTLEEGCIKAIVIAEKINPSVDQTGKTIACDYVVALEGVKIGTIWPITPSPSEPVYANCVHVSNLPEKYQKAGAVFFFRDYKKIVGPYCNTQTIPPPSPSIEVTTFFENYCNID